MSRSRRLRGVPGRVASIAIAATCLVACEALHSDSENFRRQQEAEHARRVADMRAATAQTAAGQPVTDEALRSLVAGRTHVSIYERSPDGRHERYVEYFHFRRDGRLVYLNTSWATNPDGSPGDYWRVDGPRLCLLTHWFGDDEHCYRIALTPAARLQYYIDRPGTDVDGLLTRVVDRVQDGPPQVETQTAR